METTQKPKGEAPARRPREGQNPKKPRPSGEAPRREAPASAQQRSGALRTREAQQHRRPEEKPRAPRPAAVKAPGKKPPRKPLRKPQEPDDTLSSKRRAYGNSKPKKKSAIAAIGTVFKQTAQKSAAKAKAKRAAAPKPKHPQQPTPAVIYTEPKSFNRNRFLIQVVTVAAVVLALTMGLSVFFKVENITVSGAQVYSAWAVREASGIQEGDKLLSFGNVRAGARIKKNLPYADEVRIGIKLPDTVNIIIKEEDVVYAIKSQDGIWWLMNSEGKVIEQTSNGNASAYTQILGVTLDNPQPGGKAVATENVPTETNADGELIPLATTGAQRLTAVLQILKALEANGIVGDAASIEVSRLEDIILWYGSRYQVNLGDATRLDYKITCMNDAVLQLSDYQTGVLDISFTIWPDQVGYTPFA